MSRGVIYVATGKTFIKEACESAASLKEKMPDLPITIFCNQDLQSDYFEQIVIIKEPQNSSMDKICQMYNSPYDYTLYLDTDTYICDDISELFTLLDRFDIAATHAPIRIAPKDFRTWQDTEIKGVPESFPEFNTGVILFKKSTSVEKFFSDWLTFYKKYLEKQKQLTEPVVRDQPTFREGVYKSDLRIATLTPEYNCRFVFPVFINRKVKIMHGRHPNLPALARFINKKTGNRVFVPGLGIITSQGWLQTIRNKVSNLFVPKASKP